MSYRDEAVNILKQSYPQSIPEFERVYALGRAKILAAQYLFRLMSVEEAAEWNRIVPPNSTNMDASLMRHLFLGDSIYIFKWFSFDRPYLFGRQTINKQEGEMGKAYL